MRRPWMLVVLPAVLGGALASGCTGPAAGPAVTGLPDGVSVFNHESGSHPSWVYGSWPVCLEAAGQATLRSVRISGVGPIELVGAGVRDLQPDQEGVGSQPGPLPGGLAPVNGFVARRTCTGTASELALEVRRTASGPAAVNGFDLVYASAGQERTAHYAAVIVLCNGTPDPEAAEPLRLCATQ